MEISNNIVPNKDIIERDCQDHKIKKQKVDNEVLKCVKKQLLKSAGELQEKVKELKHQNWDHTKSLLELSKQKEQFQSRNEKMKKAIEEAKKIKDGNWETSYEMKIAAIHDPEEKVMELKAEFLKDVTEKLKELHRQKKYHQKQTIKLKNAIETHKTNLKKDVEGQMNFFKIERSQFEEQTTKLENDIKFHNTNIQEHQQKVDEHKNDVERLALEKMEQTSSFKTQMKCLENRKSDLEKQTTKLKNDIKIHKANIEKLSLEKMEQSYLAASFKKQTSGLENRKSEFEEKTTKLTNSIETHNTNIQKHQEKIDERRKDVQKQMNFFKDRRSVFEVTLKNAKTK